MPIVRSISGQAAYVSPDEVYGDKPEDFFQTDPKEYERRLERARKRVLEAIRFASVPLSGRGTCHEVRIDETLGSCIEQLVDYVDRVDGRRVAKKRRQNRRNAGRGLYVEHYRIRSPQDIKRRRSALFGGTDIPAGHFGRRKMSQAEVDRFVDLMRWYLIEDAVRVMHDRHELQLVGGIWYVPVSVMDAHVTNRRPARSGRRVKQDERSFHGRPNRDRPRIAA